MVRVANPNQENGEGCRLEGRLNSLHVLEALMSLSEPEPGEW